MTGISSCRRPTYIGCVPFVMWYLSSRLRRFRILTKQSSSVLRIYEALHFSFSGQEMLKIIFLYKFRKVSLNFPMTMSLWMAASRVTKKFVLGSELLPTRNTVFHDLEINKSIKDKWLDPPLLVSCTFYVAEGEKKVFIEKPKSSKRKRGVSAGRLAGERVPEKF